jgi:hypothetical protein
MQSVNKHVELDPSTETKLGYGPDEVEFALVFRNDGRIDLYHPVGKKPRKGDATQVVHLASTTSAGNTRSVKEVTPITYIFLNNSYCCYIGGDYECYP